jgi:predicted membrane-bound spermidine synthase
MSADAASRKVLALVGLAFLLSGASALVYQVAWQRMLALSSGVGLYSMAMIVAAFMAGLGLGSHLGGVLSVRLRPRPALLAFALLEGGIALFGALSPVLLHDFLYASAARLYDAAWSAGLLHFLSLAVPTTLMGMSLPFLARALVHDAAEAGRRLGILYGLNMLGASLGALVTPWVLLRFLGIRGAVVVAAVANLLAALVALVAARRQREASHAERPSATPPVLVEERERVRFGLWLGLYALSGFCALSLEILWFRVVDVAVKSTAFTFGTVLSLYLLGSAAGSLVGSRIAPRIERPLRVFLLAQCSLLGLSALAVGALAWLPPTTPLLEWFVRYWSGAFDLIHLGSSEDPAGLARLYLLLPLFLFGAPTFLMGLSFPTLQRAVQDDAGQAARRVGFLQAANIAGCVAGSLLVGLVTLTAFGTIGTLRLLLACGLVFALVGLRHEGRASIFALAAGILAILAVVVPGPRDFWLRLHGVTTAKAAALVEEDATGVGAIFPTGGRLAVMINGLYHSWLPFGGVHTRLGAFPALVHPSPRDVAIIGLASGDTPWSSGLRAQTRSITVFEIFRPQTRLLEAAARFSWPGDLPLDGLSAFLRDERVRVVIADGRKALESQETLYDVIEADALWPEVAMSGNLFSVEFFERCARRLKPGGLMCSWTPTPRIRRTFRHVFPYVLALEGGGISIGSNEPLGIDLEAWRQRLVSPEVVAYLGGAEVAADIWQRLEKAQLRTDPPRVEFNRDLFPKDEFLTPDPARGGPH